LPADAPAAIIATIIELRKAVNEWFLDEGEGRMKYGEIANWQTGAVTDMYALFYQKTPSDLSKWDVSSVTSMVYMFYDTAFNSNLSSWNVEKAKDFGGMFTKNDAFNFESVEG